MPIETYEDLLDCHFLDGDEFDNMLYLISSDDERRVIDEHRDRATRNGLMMTGGLLARVSNALFNLLCIEIRCFL